MIYKKLLLKYNPAVDIILINRAFIRGVFMNSDMLLVCVIIFLSVALIIICWKYRSTKKKYLSTLNINNTLIEISDELCRFNDINDLYNKMLEYTIRLIKGAQYGSIMIYNKERDCMEFKALSGYDINILSTVYIKKEELFLYTLNKLSEPGIIINPLAHSRHFNKPYEDEILKNSKQLIYMSVLSAPLYINGEFFGCISVDNIETTSAFSKRDVEIIRYISTHLEIVIKNMLLVDDMKQCIVTDSLTGVFNKQYYNNLLEFNFYGKNLPDTVVVMIDMDNFKLINDTYGHIKGDAALRFFSNLLKSRFTKDSTIIRFAGDEFLLILNSWDSQEAVKILDEIEKELDNNPFEGIGIRFSYGVSKFSGGSSIEEAIKEADRNMYLQKASRKNVI